MAALIPPGWQRRRSRAAGSASTAAVGPAGRLPSGARSRGPRQNSLRSLRSLRSDSCRKSVVEARCARWPRAFRSSAPQRRCASRPAAPSLPRAAACLRDGARPCALGTWWCSRQRRGRVGFAATLRRRGAEWLGPARAQRAPPQLTCGGCLSAESAANAASSAAGPGREHRRAVGAEGADRRSRSGEVDPAAPLPAVSGVLTP